MSGNALKTEQEKEKAVLDVVERFRKGWEKCDAEQILSTIANKDDMVMYGTDLDERWIGYNSVVDPIRSMVESFESPVYSWGENEPMVWVRGDVGWVCGDLVVVMDVEEEEVNISMRSTFVVVREHGQWKIAHSHFSIGQGEPAVEYN